MPLRATWEQCKSPCEKPARCFIDRHLADQQPSQRLIHCALPGRGRFTLPWFW